MGLLEKLRDEKTEELKGRFFGIWRGVVTNVNDPEKLGRIKAKVHELFGDDEETDWASYCTPFGGGGAGWFTLPSPVTAGAEKPQAGDGVWVMFEAGDINRPVWVGFWYSKVDRPPEGADKDVRVFRTRSGHRIELSDKPGGEHVKVTDKAGNSVLLDSTSGAVTVHASKAVVDAGRVELAGAGGGVVTDATHPVCFYNGNPISGSSRVKAGS